MQRILIIGTSGSGKSTLAQRVSTSLCLPYFPSDPFYWEAEWKPASPEQVKKKLMGVLDHEAWVLDGNFDNQRELLWKYADCIVWLDYSLPVILSQVIRRNLGWGISRKITWSENRMNLSRAWSGIRHTIRSYPEKRKLYPQYLSEVSPVMIHRFRTHYETEAWLTHIRHTE